MICSRPQVSSGEEREVRTEISGSDFMTRHKLNRQTGDLPEYQTVKPDPEIISCAGAFYISAAQCLSDIRVIFDHIHVLRDLIQIFSVEIVVEH